MSKGSRAMMIIIHVNNKYDNKNEKNDDRDAEKNQTDYTQPTKLEMENNF